MELQIRAQKHIDRLDATMHAAEVKWGVPFKLGSLVETELAEKFERQWSMLSSAITENRYEDVCKFADGAIRGIWALDKAAALAGHTPQALQPIGMAVMASKGEEDGARLIEPLPRSFWRQGGDSLDDL